MSTYYYFGCSSCREYGGLLTRQAWGWGNFDIWDSFAFLRHHIEQCGEDKLVVLSEHDERGWTHTEPRESPIAGEVEEWNGWKLVDYRSEGFPHSNEWGEYEALYADYRGKRT